MYSYPFEHKLEAILIKEFMFRQGTPVPVIYFSYGQLEKIYSKGQPTTTDTPLQNGFKPRSIIIHKAYVHKILVKLSVLDSQAEQTLMSLT